MTAHQIEQGQKYAAEILAEAQTALSPAKFAAVQKVINEMTERDLMDLGNSMSPRHRAMIERIDLACAD
jgi:hypothetical protein